MTKDARGRRAGTTAHHPVRPERRRPPPALQEAMQHHRAGRLGEAERLYRGVLAADPRQPDALNLLGMIAHQTGHPQDALRLLDQAMALDGRAPDYQNNAGLVLLHLGRLREAKDRFFRATAEDPGHLDANLNLGGLALEEGRPDDAARHFRTVLKRRSDRVEAHRGLGTACLALGRWREAADSLRAAMRLGPPPPDLLYNLGNALRELGEPAEAEITYRQALTLRPDFAEAHGNLARALSDQGRSEEAERHYRRVVELRPGEAQGPFNLAVALQRLDRLTEAEAGYRQALALRPDYAEALCNLGAVQLVQGRVAEAVACQRQALAARPGFPQAVSSLLMTLCYDDRLSAAALAAEHRRLAPGLAPESPMPPPKPPTRRDAAGRRLRIGYVSADFRQHSCAYFLEPLLAAHDRVAVEVFCYSDVGSPDEVTRRFERLAEHWRVIAGADDASAAEQIEADGIDVLVDLHGHTAGHRLSLFARRPGRVRLAWLGYPATTGLPALEFRLTDSRADPEGVTDAFHTERLLRLPGGFLAYRPPEAAPPVEPAPAFGGRPLTFGSFNSAAKVSPATARLWGEILRRAPGSRLLLKARPFADPGVREAFAARLEAAGISRAAVELAPWAATVEGALDAYRSIDIALDPFPYNGATTTCEALWMGVPVIALAGAAHAGRVGASLLHMVGLSEFVASDPADYVSRAAALAGDPAARLALRRTLRGRMCRSSLLDGKRFAAEFEAACRTALQAAPDPAPATEP